MSKHSTALKQSVVDLYLSGDESYRSAGSVFGIDPGTVRQWVAFHALHGVAGLSRKFSHYSSDFKLSVLQRMKADGLSHRQTAALFNIRNASCLADWQKCYDTGEVDALTPRRKGRPRLMSKPPVAAVPVADDPEASEPQASPRQDTRSRQDLLVELAYLRMENAYLKKLEALTQSVQPAQPKREPFRR